MTGGLEAEAVPETMSALVGIPVRVGDLVKDGVKVLVGVLDLVGVSVIVKVVVGEPVQVGEKLIVGVSDPVIMGIKVGVSEVDGENAEVFSIGWKGVRVTCSG